MRASSAICLGHLKPQGALEALIKAVNDPEEWVRFSAVEGLGLLKDPRAQPALLSLIVTGEGVLMEAAIDALSCIATSDDAPECLSNLNQP